MVTAPTIEYASLGMWDSLILMLLALVVFGPRRMPEIGRRVGRLMYELRKASSDFKIQMEEELRVVEEDDRRKKEEARLKALEQTAPAAPVETAAPAALTAGTEAPASTGSTESAPVESPYPGEFVYPPTETPAVPPTPVEPAPAAAQGTVSEAVPETGTNGEQSSQQPGIAPEQTSTEPVKQNG
jgi:sec-independent protein translocase protein TatB